MALENSISRNRTIAMMVAIDAKLIEAGELEERLARLEATLEPREAAGSDDPLGLG